MGDSGAALSLDQVGELRFSKDSLAMVLRVFLALNLAHFLRDRDRQALELEQLDWYLALVEVLSRKPREEHQQGKPVVKMGSVLGGR